MRLATLLEASFASLMRGIIAIGQADQSSAILSNRRGYSLPPPQALRMAENRFGFHMRGQIAIGIARPILSDSKASPQRPLQAARIAENRLELKMRLPLPISILKPFSANVEAKKLA